MMASDWLPQFLRVHLAKRDTLRRALDNSFWLFCEQLLRMGMNLAVGVWMARYLGPGAFGVLSYALAVVAVVGASVSLGLNAIVVREAARSSERAPAWLGTAFVIRLLGAMAGVLICVAVAGAQSPAGPHARGVILIVTGSLAFQVFEVFDLQFQAAGVARVSAWVRMAACLLTNGLKAALILGHASIVAFALTVTVEAALTAIGWLCAAIARGWRIKRWHYERTLATTLLRESWPLALSSLAVYVQAYADQVMLGALLGVRDLGQYAAAMRLIGAFAFVPMVIQTVAAPEIAQAKHADEHLYWRRLHGLYRLMSGLFLCTALPLVFLGPMVVRLFYGAAYAGAAALLPWLALRLFFTNFGVARSLFITNESLFRFALVTSVVGAAANLALNFFLIPRWGALGAVVSSLISFAVTIFILEWMQPKARKNLRLMVSAALLPWRRLNA